MKKNRREILVDGLTEHERLTLLEKAVPKLWRSYEEQQQKVEDLTHEVNRLRMPWWLRWLFPKPEDEDAKSQAGV